MIHNEIVAEAIEYILNNIWNGVTLGEVAWHVNMSVSRFSSIFKEQTGESVYAFIKRIKMEQSAFKLKLETDREITEIGEEYGYSASNYSSAFSQYHKMPPSTFRQESLHSTKLEEDILQDIIGNVRIEYKPDYTVMYQRTIGNYEELQIEWCKFVNFHEKEITENTIFFERTFDDPTITDRDRCIYDICMSTNQLEKYKNTCVLKGGKFVVYPYKGYLWDIYSTHQQLIGVWFPGNHLEIDQRYSYDQYKLVREDGYMEFDICIPVK